MLYELILINEIEQRAKIIFLSVYAAVMQDCRLFGGCIEQTHSVLILVSSNWTKLFLLL